MLVCKGFSGVPGPTPSERSGQTSVSIRTRRILIWLPHLQIKIPVPANVFWIYDDHGNAFCSNEWWHDLCKELLFGSLRFSLSRKITDLFCPDVPEDVIVFTISSFGTLYNSIILNSWTGRNIRSVVMILSFPDQNLCCFIIFPVRNCNGHNDVGRAR